VISFRILRRTPRVATALAVLAWALLPLPLAAQTITFLGDRDLAPYEFLVNGVPRGANVDLANAIGRVLGRKVEIELLDWSEAQGRVKAGRGDALTMLGKAAEREADYSFTQETLPVAFALFVRTSEKRDSGEAALPESLGKRRIGVTQGGLARSLLERAYPEATFVVVDNLLDGTRRLLARDIDAFGAQVWSETFLLSELGIRGIASLPPFAERRGNIAVRKGNEALRADLDRALTQLKASGELDAIIDHWSSTRLQLVSENTIIGLAIAGGVGIAMVLLLSAGLLWSRRQKAALSREVEERRKAEEALRESQAALEAADSSKDRFIATLAHELRNPLAPISNAVRLLEMKGGESDEARWARQVIGRQTAHLTRLIDDLLDVGRITSGKLELRRAPCLLWDVVRDAVEVSQPLIEGRRHSLEVRQPDEAVWLNVDKARLVQVVMNLLTNAAKYTPGGGVIRLEAELAGDDLVLHVQDQGVGIPDDQLDDIFEMFHQESRSLRHAGGGLGIGLWITRRLVQMHGGSIEARSDGVGQGAQFTVRIPSARCAAPASIAAVADDARPRVVVPSVRALVVDDNVDSAESTSMLLGMDGCEVETAFDGEQALAAAARGHFQLVLLDLAMPKVNGHEVCRRLRALDWGRDAVIVAMTGWGGESDKRSTREAGFDDHLVKPIDPEELRKMLQRWR
jgi:signal transduction histidine kinase